MRKLRVASKNVPNACARTVIAIKGPYLLWTTLLIPISERDLTKATHGYGMILMAVTACAFSLISLINPTRVVVLVWLAACTSWDVFHALAIILLGQEERASRIAELRSMTGYLLWIPALVLCSLIVDYHEVTK